MKALAKRTTLLLVLVACALGWVFLMSLGQSKQASATGADGSQATMTYLDDSEFARVTIYLSVVDGAGQPLTGLGRDAFELTEDQIPVEFETFIEAGKQPIVAVLLIDHSGSMGRQGKMEGAREAAKTFLDQLQDGRDRIGVIAFDDQQSPLYRLNLISSGDRAALKAQIDRLNDEGGTAYYDAVYDAVSQLQGQVGRKVIIAMTDGNDEDSRYNLQTVIDLAQENDVLVYTVGLGGDVQSSILERMARETGGQYYPSPSASELAALYRDLAQALQNEYSLTYTSPTPNRDGTQRDVAVTITHPGATLSAGDRYNPGGILNPKFNPWLFLGLAALLVGLLFMPNLRQAVKGRQEAPVEAAPRPQEVYPPPQAGYRPPPGYGPPPPPPSYPSPAYPQQALPTYTPPSTPPAQPATACPRCGAPLRPQAKFCGSCGLPRATQ